MMAGEYVQEISSSQVKIELDGSVEEQHNCDKPNQPHY